MNSPRTTNSGIEAFLSEFDRLSDTNAESKTMSPSGLVYSNLNGADYATSRQQQDNPISDDTYGIAIFNLEAYLSNTNNSNSLNGNQLIDLLGIRTDLESSIKLNPEVVPKRLAVLGGVYLETARVYYAKGDFENGSREVNKALEAFAYLVKTGHYDYKTIRQALEHKLAQIVSGDKETRINQSPSSKSMPKYIRVLVAPSQVPRIIYSIPASSRLAEIGSNSEKPDGEAYTPIRNAIEKKLHEFGNGRGFYVVGIYVPGEEPPKKSLINEMPHQQKGCAFVSIPVRLPRNVANH